RGGGSRGGRVVTRRARARVAPSPASRSANVGLLAAVGLLLVLGLAMVLSASSVYSLGEGRSAWYYTQRQLIWCGLGLVALFIMAGIDYRLWRRVVGLLVIGSILMLAAVLVPGIGIAANGSRRWLGMGALTIQPSEIARFALVVYVADLLAARRAVVADVHRSLYPVLFLLAPVCLLVMLQPDLGSTLLIVGVVVAMLLAGGVPLSSLGRWALAGASLAMLAAILEPYRRDRLLAFLDPWSDPQGNTQQSLQSLVGIASGGLTGSGLGEGRAKWGYLPFPHTDFIFATVAEELGFIGAALLIVLFVVVTIAGFRIALHAPDRFGTLLGIGVTLTLVSQAFVNIGAVIGLLPITGVPLPFISVGGTSMVVSMASVGVLASIAKRSTA
ncbi:MAG: putative lipid II flippase FtsW, partial [Acidimicrobiales bacterium]|nr:putative lipid II flippase FtsW [Acidimicrobiales bacterium]